MGEPKKKKKRSSFGTDATESKQERRYERRFEPVTPQKVYGLGALAALGSAALGAGVYGQLLRDEPHQYGTHLVIGGALTLAAMILVIPAKARPLLVGDAGVGFEPDGDTPRRLGWYEIDQVAYESGAVVVRGNGQTIRADVAAHPKGAAWLVREARERIPAKVTVSGEVALDQVSAEDGERRRLEEPQVAGRHCKESGKPISFEEDAVLCGRCGEVYLKDHVPADCMTCGAKGLKK